MWRWRLLALTIMLGLLVVLMPEKRADARRPIQEQQFALDHDWVAVKQLLNIKCRSCHHQGEHELIFDSHQSIVDGITHDGRPLVVPNNAEESALYQMVLWEPAQCASRPGIVPNTPAMPENEEEWLTAGQLALMERWISRGAPLHGDTLEHATLTELDFPSARECKSCHPKQFAEWSRSMHAYAQKSPVFEAFYLTMAERTNGTVGTFCTRCHTPVGTILGESGQLANIHRSKLSMEGISCVSCHRRDRQQGRMSGRLALQPGDFDEGCMFGPFDDPLIHGDNLHPSAGSDYLRTSSFCGSCHDVTNPQGLRLEEAFSEWRASPAARKGITCHHCHMGPVPGVPTAPEDRPLGYAATLGPGSPPLKLRPLSDHTFAGPDYSLLDVAEFPEKLDWMDEIDFRDPARLSDYHRRTLEAVSERNLQSLAIATSMRHQLLRNAARLSVNAPASVASGDKTAIRVSVTSLFEGHNFPTGFTEERQAWVEIIVRDQTGQVLYQSGDRDSNGDLRDAGSHAVLTGKVPYDKDLMNFQSKFIVLAERGTERPVTIPVNRDIGSLNILRPATETASALGRPSVMRIQKSNLPPLATRTNKYAFRVPGECQQINYSVRLLYRHLPPDLLDQIGTPHLKPLLEIVVIDECSGVIEVSPSKRSLPWKRGGR